MRLSYSLGSILSIEEVLNCTRILSRTNIDTIWVPETWGMENFSMMGALSQIPGTFKLGSSIINIYSRSPSAVAMGAVTVDTISKGRFILGLGTSSMPIVEEFHGYKFDKPVHRMKEYVEIIRLIVSLRRVDYSGDIFKLKNFSLLIKPFRDKIPIYLAAVNKKMVDLTWEIADGVIFYLRPIDELGKTISTMQKKRKIDVACQIITAVSNDSEAAFHRAKKTIAFYISVAKFYREFLARNGFASETKNIFEEFKKSRFNHNLVTDRMIHSLAIAGTPEECRQKLNTFRNTGIDLPILQFNPVGDTLESFHLFVKTFSEEKK